MDVPESPLDIWAPVLTSPVVAGPPASVVSPPEVVAALVEVLVPALVPVLAPALPPGPGPGPCPPVVTTPPLVGPAPVVATPPSLVPAGAPGPHAISNTAPRDPTTTRPINRQPITPGRRRCHHSGTSSCNRLARIFQDSRGGSRAQNSAAKIRSPDQGVDAPLARQAPSVVGCSRGQLLLGQGEEELADCAATLDLEQSCHRSGTCDNSSDDPWQPR